MSASEPATCRKCGANVEGTWAFCRLCGEKLDSARRWWLISIAVLLPIVGIVAVIVALSGGSESAVPAAVPIGASGELPGSAVFESAVVASAAAEAPSGPDDVELPEPSSDDSEQAAELIGSDGAALLEFLRATGGLWEQAPLSEEGCSDLAGEFESIAAPDELAAMAWAIEDDVARDVLTSLVASTVEAMADCFADGERTAEIAWNWAVSHRRLAELGVVAP